MHFLNLFGNRARQNALLEAAPLHDGHCRLCLALQEVAPGQPRWVALSFVAQGSPACAECFPTLHLETSLAPEEAVVVGDDGRVWRGGHAWLMLLSVLLAYLPLSV